MAVEPDDFPPPAGKKSNKLLWIALIGLVVVVIGIGSAWWLSSGDDDESAATNEEQNGEQVSNETPREEELGSAYYIPMPRNFIFNVPGAERDRVVQINIQLMVRGARNEGLAQRHIPIIEGTLLQIFSTSTADRLQTAEGKREIRAQALDAVRDAMIETTGSPVVEELLFTDFVMQ